MKMEHKINIFRFYNILLIGVIVVVYFCLNHLKRFQPDIVYDIIIASETLATSLFVTQITCSFLVVSVTAMLSTKGKTVYWDDTISYMLVNPPRTNLYAITNYCFFDIAVSFISLLINMPVAVVVSFSFNLIFLMCMTYKLLKIYFGVEMIQKEMQHYYYNKISKYERISVSHQNKFNKHKEKILKQLENELTLLHKETKSKTIDAIFEYKINDVALNMTFLIDAPVLIKNENSDKWYIGYCGYDVLYAFVTRNDMCKEDYLNAFFQLRMKQLKTMSDYCEGIYNKEYALIMPHHKKFCQNIVADKNAWNKFNETYWWMNIPLFSDFYGNEENGYLNITLQLLEVTEYSVTLIRSLFSFIVADEWFMCEYITRKDMGECVAYIICKLIEQNKLAVLNNILDILYFNKKIIGDGFVSYFIENKEFLNKLEEWYKEFSSIPQITVDVIFQITGYKITS